MHKTSLRHRALTLVVGVFALAFAGWASADPPARIARLGYLSGAVSFSPAGEDDWLQATIKQQVIAHMLGVRRESVTEAAHKLQKLSLVRCGRGRIAVLDRRGLEQRACECYSVVRKEYGRLQPDRRAAQATAQQRATPVGALRPVRSLAH
jgi:Crp-like helix-turn-helix domain